MARFSGRLALCDDRKVDVGALAAEIASIPERIRDYGHVKDKHLAEARERREKLLAAWRSPVAPRIAA